MGFFKSQFQTDSGQDARVSFTVSQIRRFENYRSSCLIRLQPTPHSVFYGVLAAVIATAADLQVFFSLTSLFFSSLTKDSRGSWLVCAVGRPPYLG